MLLFFVGTFFSLFIRFLVSISTNLNGIFSFVLGVDALRKQGFVLVDDDNSSFPVVGELRLLTDGSFVFLDEDLARFAELFHSRWLRVVYCFY